MCLCTYLRLPPFLGEFRLSRKARQHSRFRPPRSILMLPEVAVAGGAVADRQRRRAGGRGR